MNGSWQTFWHVIIALALISYFGLALVIAVGGAFDVRKMFRRLSAPHESDLENTVTSDVPTGSGTADNNTNDSLG